MSVFLNEEKGVTIVSVPIDEDICPACKSRRNTYLHLAKDSFYSIDIMRPISVLLCLNCGCVYTKNDDLEKIRKEVGFDD